MAVSQSVTKLALSSSVPLGWLFTQLDLGLIAGPSKNVLETMWTRTSEAYRKLGGPGRSFLTQDDVLPFDGVSRPQIDSAVNQIRHYAPHDTHPTEMFNVRISKLVTPQLLVNPKRAEKRADVKARMTPSELFEVSTKAGKHTEPISKQIIGQYPAGAYLFTSSDEDVRPLVPVYKTVSLNDEDEQSPKCLSVCFPIGGSLPMMNAYRVRIDEKNTRLIINNGVHRLYALTSKGNEWCPLIVTDLAPQEMGDPFVNFSRESLLGPKSDPPLVTDFLKSEVTMSLGYFPSKSTVRLNYSLEHYPTVMR